MLTFDELIGVLVGLVLLVLVGSCCVSVGVNRPGTGEKVGQIVRVSREGVFCKTMEAQIMRGGFNDGSGVVGRSFEFTVENSRDAVVLADAMRNQKEVVIRYRTEGVYAKCRSGSDGDFLTSVEYAPIKGK